MNFTCRATGVTGGFWSGSEKQGRDVGKNHLPDKETAQRGSCFGLLVFGVWLFNARLRVCPKLLPTSTTHTKGVGKTLGDCSGVRGVSFLLSVGNKRIKGLAWGWGVIHSKVSRLEVSH